MTVVSEFFNTFFPYACPLCNNHAKKILCDSCFHKLKPYSGKRCLKCSRPLPDESNILCAQCLKDVAFKKGFSLFSYEEIKEVIYCLKYRNMPYVVHLLKFFSKEIKKSGIFNDASFLIPVPMYPQCIPRK